MTIIIQKKEEKQKMAFYGHGFYPSGRPVVVVRVVPAVYVVSESVSEVWHGGMRIVTTVTRFSDGSSKTRVQKYV